MGELFDYKMLKMVKTILKNQSEILIKLEKMEERMSEELDLLELQVAETLGAEQSAITLLNGISERLTTLADELEEAGIDNTKVTALRDELDASEQALAAAVAANQPQ
jgi:hypothetical protein